MTISDPVRFAVADLSADFRKLRWFARIGSKPQAEDRDLACIYCSRLGFPQTVPIWLHDLGAAEGTLRRGGEMPEWRRAEGEAAEALTRAAAAALGEATANEAVNRVMLAASDAAMDAARRIFPQHGHGGEALMRVAAGAAARAAGEYTLVILAGADPATHAFGAKRQLFAASRWPLLAVENQLALL